MGLFIIILVSNCFYLQNTVMVCVASWYTHVPKLDQWSLSESLKSTGKGLNLSKNLAQATLALCGVVC